MTAPTGALPGATTWRSWDLDPAWSRTIDVASHDGSNHRWHLLDTGETADPSHIRSTILCVHGNPTWAYAWATFLRRLGADHRVIAVDQLGMGFSERTGQRRYADRVADFADAVEALDVDPSIPLFIAAHDWGGAVAMGWAVDHPDRLAGLILCNTGIAVPAGRAAPSLIRLAASAPLRDLVCRRTPTFVEGTVRLARGRMSSSDRAAFRAPYRRAADRAAIADFVGDVPLRSPHPSESALDTVAARLGEIGAPVLLAWGGSDPVFDDEFAADLAGRFPNASLHRFADANHLVMVEADVAGVAQTWLDDRLTDRAVEADRADDGTSHAGVGAFSPLWSEIAARSHDGAVALHDAARGLSLTFSDVAARVDAMAAELARRGVRPGDRVAMVTPPGVDLIVAVYAVWRAGAVTVIADRGLGLKGLGAALGSTRPQWVIGPRAARAAARVLRWAPRAAGLDIYELVAASRSSDGPAAPEEPAADEPAAILFTSGATGPAKGVRYTHRQLGAQREALRELFSISPQDRLVAAFAPFALYGPSLGIATALPDCDVTAPGELTATALDHACRAIGATMVFGSPAALANVVATAGRTPADALANVRIVMSAGAPVPSETLRAMAALVPHAELHTPYGMTEALPVADLDLVGIERAEATSTAGVCVGPPVPGAEVRIVPLDFEPLDGVPDAVDDGETGEVLVRAPWVSLGYLGRWETQRRARPGDGWHRTGDVGHVDQDGRLWIEGRTVHVIHAVNGPITSVAVERTVESADIGGVTPGRVAAVGVGPDGIQQLVIVIESSDRGDNLAPDAMAQAVRGAVDHPIAAVLTVKRLPVDIRHNAKIDRTAVAERSAATLSGRGGR